MVSKSILVEEPVICVGNTAWAPKGLERYTTEHIGKGAMIFILSQKGYGICIFETHHDDMKCDLGIKESYFNAGIAYAQGREDDQADRK